MKSVHRVLTCTKCGKVETWDLPISISNWEVVVKTWDHALWKGEKAFNPCQYCDAESYIKLVPHGTLSVS